MPNESGDVFVSRLKEQRLWDAVKRNAPKGWWLQRVENVVAEGMPDVYVTKPTGASVWVELKAPIRPKRKTTRLLGTEGLRESQIGWHLKAHTKNLPAFTLIRDDELVLYLVHCSLAQTVNDLSLLDMQQYRIDNWEDLWETLSTDNKPKGKR
jgi:hypothetical protein